MASGRLKLVLGVAAVVLVAGAALGYKFFEDNLTVSLPDYPPVSKAVWLDQNWSQKDRRWFHHTSQGTQTVNIPYEWFIALEQPRLSLFGDVGRLADADYLDRFGFIPGAADEGESRMPVGFAIGQAMQMVGGAPWTNPATGQTMRSLGFTCAACHTGRMTYQGTALLVDGGPALTNLGKFRQALGLSLLFTRKVPGRFERFAANVLGPGASDAAKTALRQQLEDIWQLVDTVRTLDQSVEKASVEEGYGRLDALNRIGNQVFGLDLGEEGRKKNYAPTTAPVNFPHIWSTSWFDWVQYNASIMQPMVRNAGEALGVSAPVNLTDAKSLFATRVQIQQLAEMEDLLAGHQPDATRGFDGLKAPRWPDDTLPKADPKLAAQGARLYDGLCKGCHLPPVGSAAFWASPKWLEPNKFGQRYLEVTTKEISDVGTDEAQAADMKARKVWSPANLQLGTEEFGPALGQVVEKTITHWYDSQIPPTPEAERYKMNGYRPNDIQAPLAYKARPLNGVWATAPFLHNGAVPNVYALLSPVGERPTSFYLGRRDFDPVCMGVQLQPVPAPADQPDQRCLGLNASPDAGQFDGGFRMDTSLRGNRNRGHEFNDGPQGNGIVGRKLQPDERRALIEFLKTDCAVGWSPQGAEASPTSCENLAKL